MKKFKFRLEKVLKLRENREEEIQVILARAVEKRDQARADLKGLQTHRNNMAQKLEYFKSNPYGVEDLLIYQGYIDNVDSRIRRHHNYISELDKEVDEIRALLLQATKEKKMLETVKDKQECRHKYDLKRKENGFFDEIGVIRSARKLLDRG